MATTSIRITHERAGDFTVASNARLSQVISRLQNFLQGGIAGNYAIDAIELSQDQATGTVTLSNVGGVAATGSYALSGVGGTAASGSITFSGSTGAWTATVNGVVFAGSSAGDDDAEGDDLATQIEASVDVAIAGIVTAVNDNGVVTITADAKGTAGNAVTLAVTGTGVARSAATLTGGVQGAVTLTINGTAVGPVNTTNITDTAAATAVAAAIELNGTLAPLLVAVGSTTNVSLTWGAKGTAGNAVTLAAGVSATGTATRSGATLTGGAENTVTVTVGGTAVPTVTTNLSDDAAATAVSAALNANGTVADYVTASAVTTVVTLTALAAGEEGNAISLVSATTGGTATASGATLSGGSSTTHTR
jgi:phage tail sheath gpL-like